MSDLAALRTALTTGDDAMVESPVQIRVGLRPLPIESVADGHNKFHILSTLDAQYDYLMVHYLCDYGPAAQHVNRSVRVHADGYARQDVNAMTDMIEAAKTKIRAAIASIGYEEFSMDTHALPHGHNQQPPRHDLVVINARRAKS